MRVAGPFADINGQQPDEEAGLLDIDYSDSAPSYSHNDRSPIRVIPRHVQFEGGKPKKKDRDPGLSQ